MASRLLGLQSCIPAIYGFLPGATESFEPRLMQSLIFHNLLLPAGWFTAGKDVKVLRKT
jgi:hypothetical protein